MTKKKLILIVGALAVISSAVTLMVRYANSENRLIGSRVEPAYELTEEVTRYDEPAGYALGNDGMGGAQASKMIAPDIYPYPVDDNALSVDARVYEKSSYHQFVVDDVTSYVRSMKEYVLSIDGRVINQSQGTQGRYGYANLYLKVPVAKFEEASTRVSENVKKVISESISADDRTGTVVSIQDQITAKQTEVELKRIDLDEATTATQQRRIQLEINQLERMIAQLQEQQNSVTEQVEYATISVNVSTSENYYNPEYFDIRLMVEAAWASLLDKLAVILYGIIWVLVYSVIWLPVVGGFLYISKRFNKTTSK